MECMSEELISAFDIRGTEETGLDIECAWNVGKALADWLPVSGSVVVLATPAAAKLADAVVEGLRLQGRNVILEGSGDNEAAAAQVKTFELAGAVVVGWDDLEKMNTLSLLQENGQLITMETGLKEIREFVLAGNFVPAVIKGEISRLA